MEVEQTVMSKSKEYRKRIDSSDESSKRLWEYDEGKVARQIAPIFERKGN